MPFECGTSKQCPVSQDRIKQLGWLPFGYGHVREWRLLCPCYHKGPRIHSGHLVLLLGSSRREKGLAWSYSVEDGSWAGDRMREAMHTEARKARVQGGSGQKWRHRQKLVLGGRVKGASESSTLRVGPGFQKHSPMPTWWDRAEKGSLQGIMAFVCHI